MRLPEVELFCLPAAGRCMDFWFLHGDFTLKKLIPVSVAVLSAILPTTWEKADQLLHIDQGMKVSI